MFVGKFERVHQWVDQELEVLVSTAEAERTLETIKEEKKMLILQKQELQNMSQDDETAENLKLRISEIDDAIQLRTTHIADVEQEIKQCNTENRAKTRWDTVQSMVEAKIALKYLFEVASESKKKELLTHIISSEEKDRLANEHNEEIENIHQKYQKEIADLEVENQKLNDQLQTVIIQMKLNNVRNGTPVKHFNNSGFGTPKTSLTPMVNIS